MSNWDRNFASGANHNLGHRSTPGYQQNGNSGSGPGNRRSENWQKYYVPENSEMINQPLQANPMLFVQNHPNFYSNETFNRSHRPRGYTQGAQSLDLMSSAGIPSSRDVCSDIWTKAANSALTPTAGEFIPSLTYQSANYHQSVSGPESSRPPSNQTSGSGRTRNYQQKNYDPLKGNRYKNENFTSSSSEKQYHNSRWPQNRGPDRGRNNGSKNNKKNQMLEDLKAEGRKKLLEEAAGLINAKPVSETSSAQASNTRSSGPDSAEGSWRTHNDHHAENGTVRYQDYRKSSSRDNIPSRNDKQRDQYNTFRRYSPPNEANSVSNSLSKRDENISHIVSPRKERSHSSKDIAVSQRDRLTEQLNRGTLECLVCCERVRQFDQVWSCCNCYHVLHLRCIIKWAKTSKAESGWRCPACQNVTMSVPQDYHCFCGKTTDPEWNRSDIAHSCGEVCNRDKVNASEHYVCIHRCTLLCHPGPCPSCVALVTRKCGCGKTSQTVQCGQIQPLLCGDECGKPLNCKEHTCKEICHLGDCQSCKVKITQSCFCGKESREVDCDGVASKILLYACEGNCSKKLNCGYHPCTKKCHDGPCGNCSLDPSIITHCYCGKTELTEEQKRTSCLDPLPMCGSVCGKILNCGQPSSPHTCSIPCHEGPCPPCVESTLVRCRCGYMDREIPCVELTTKADDARCQKKCTKKRMCGKHKCNQFCCIDVDHVCPFPCNHILTCGQHRCEQLCHRGHCQPCLRSSFEELYCECGRSVLFPPIPCGTRPPPCCSPCSRQHSCNHPVLHNCHSLPECPPCSVLTAKYCHGKHELRKTVPCHLEEFSCGLPCGKALNCGRHNCILPCHGGECLKPGQTCKQPCTIPRDLCGHACNNPCHDGDCVDTPCKETVIVTCICGNQSTSRPCYENNSEYHRIATALLASKMADVQLGRSVHLGDMQGARKMSLKTLDCNEECRLLERNRRLAIGLQIRNPDLSSKLTPRYSDFMRGWAKKDARFCQNVHDKLTELVQLAKQSKQKSRSYSFETMNREKRQFVHECCEHFGCESVAYDAEPKRNVVATAQKDRAWLPSYSLLEVLRREMGHRKPVPLNNADKKPANQQRSVAAQPVRLSVNQTMASITAGNTASAQPMTSYNGSLPTLHTSPPVIDYFGMD